MAEANDANNEGAQSYPKWDDNPLSAEAWAPRLLGPMADKEQLIPDTIEPELLAIYQKHKVRPIYGLYLTTAAGGGITSVEKLSLIWSNRLEIAQSFHLAVFNRIIAADKLRYDMSGLLGLLGAWTEARSEATTIREVKAASAVKRAEENIATEAAREQKEIAEYHFRKS